MPHLWPRPPSRWRVANNRFLLAFAVVAAACGPLAARQARHTPQSQAVQGLRFAQAHCAGCHAVERNQISPNPEAPPWENVVNKEGLTPETLTWWLRHSHNFPEIMNFEIEDAQVDALVAYMLTLRDPRPLSREPARHRP